MMFSLDDHVSCHVELGKALKCLNKYNDFDAVSSNAETLFKDLPKLFYFVKLKSGFHLEKNQVDIALKELASVPPVSDLFNYM